MSELHDHDFGLLVREKLISLGLDKVHNHSSSYNYTHRERKAVIENNLKSIYDMIGSSDNSLLKELSENIYKSYQGMSYRNFPKLKTPRKINGTINGIDKSVTFKVQVIDQGNWNIIDNVTMRLTECESHNYEVSSLNIQLLLDYFASRPVFDLEILARQVEESMKLLYKEESNFKIKAHIFYSDY